MPVKKSKKELEEEVRDKIPISVSIKQLNEQFPWLRDINWNNREGEDENGE